MLTIEESLELREVIYGSDNVFKRFLIGAAMLTKVSDAADRIVDGEYRVPHQEQLYIETQGMIAIPGERLDDGDGLDAMSVLRPQSAQTVIQPRTTNRRL